MPWLFVVLLILSTLTLGGCEVVGDIFKTGFWAGAVAVILLVVGIGVVASKMRG